MLNLTPKLIFLLKTPNFSKKAPSAPKLWALRARNSAPIVPRKTVPGGEGQQVRNHFTQCARLSLILRFQLILDLPIIRSFVPEVFLRLIESFSSF